MAAQKPHDMKELKEELTTKMHSEFNVTPSTDQIHRAQSAALAVKNGMKIERAANLYGITKALIIQQK